MFDIQSLLRQRQQGQMPSQLPPLPQTNPVAGRVPLQMPGQAQPNNARWDQFFQSQGRPTPQVGPQMPAQAQQGLSQMPSQSPLSSGFFGGSSGLRNRFAAR